MSSLIHLSSFSGHSRSHKLSRKPLLEVLEQRELLAYQFTSFDVPGGFDTRAHGINDAGQIVGYYSGAGGDHGFLKTGANYTALDATSLQATNTYAFGLNNGGQIVGMYRRTDTSFHQHGFLRTSGAFAEIVAPSATDTSGDGINDAGQIVGHYSLPNPSGGADLGRGFVRTGGTFEVIHASSIGAARVTYALGINNAGHVVGWYIDASERVHGFLKDSAGYSAINFPGVPFNTSPEGINSAGVITGLYMDSSGRQHGFVKSSTGFETLDYPLATSTNAIGINSSGQIVGSYRDSAGRYHGFVATPQTDIAMQSAQLQAANNVQFTYETTGNPGPFQAGLYRSADTTFDASDTLIDTETVTPSPTNPQAPGSFTLPQPLPGDPSQSYLLVVADPDNAISESNENNNVQGLSLFCLPNDQFPVDLVSAEGIINSLPKGLGITLRLDEYTTVFSVNSPNGLEPGALCSATASTAGAPRTVSVILDGVPFPSIPVGSAANSEVTVTVFEAAPSSTPDDDFMCTFATGAHRCWLNEHVPGHRVARWLTRGFDVTGIGLEVHTGPLEEWVDLESLPLGLTPQDSFQTYVDRAEQLIEDVNQDVVFRREVLSLWQGQILAIFDPGETDLLVTDPNGMQTGLTPTGSIVNEIPDSVYVPTIPIVLVLNPNSGQYTTEVIGRVTGDYELVTALLDSDVIVAQQSYSGTLAQGELATYSSALDTASGSLTTNLIPTAHVVGSPIGVRGQPLRFVVRATDSADDEAAGFAYAIHWGDGTTSTTNRSVGNGVGSPINHVYAQSGNYTVEVVATDQSGGVSDVVTQVITISGMAIEPDPDDLTKLALAVGGMAGNDVIVVGIHGRVISMVTPTAAGTEVTVGIFLPGMPNNESVDSFGNVTVRIITANVSSFSRFMLFGQEGNDVLYVGPFNRAPAELDGGVGDDQLIGGSGADILIGGLGNDTLTGGAGRDLLIGGDGADRLVGDGGDDILVAGSTAYDSNWEALRAIRNEWTRTDIDYASRVDHLRGVGAGLNGGFAFTKQTVFDDQAVDVLIGGSGQDWFVGDFSGPVTERDRVIDQVIGERISDIEFDLM